MTKLEFSNKLVNLEYSLSKEYLSTNRIGGYMCSTPVCCNTARYHGLMVCPVPQLGSDNHLLLSSIDETLIQGKMQFNLAVHRFPGAYAPNGNKYVVKFSYSPIPTLYYAVGDLQIKKEMVWLRSRNHLLVRYTLLSCDKPIVLRVRPFLAFRKIDELRKADLFINTHYRVADGGICCNPYKHYPSLYIQNNAQGEFFPAPDWYYNFEYQKDMSEGLDFQEDLFTPGVFDIELSQEQSVVFSFSTGEIPSCYFNALFDEEIKRHSFKEELQASLEHSAGQFIVLKKDQSQLITAYPGKTMRVKDTFQSIVELAMVKNNKKLCLDVLDGLIEQMNGGLFPSGVQKGEDPETSLWFFYVLQQMEQIFSRQTIWDRYGGVMKEILETYSYGIEHLGVSMHDNGLIWCEQSSFGRRGYLVEVCALWYNAVCYGLSLAAENGDFVFASQWESFDVRIRKSFNDMFFLTKQGYLADYVYDDIRNTDVRANQVVACVLPFGLLQEDQLLTVMSALAYHLRCERGLRTLSPNNAQYIFSAENRHKGGALENGAVSMFMTYLYVKSYYAIHPDECLRYVRDVVAFFEEDYVELGTTTISDYYRGDPPYEASGAVSSAVGVAALLAMLRLLDVAPKV